MKNLNFYPCVIGALLLLFVGTLVPVEAQQPKPKLEPELEEFLRTSFYAMTHSVKRRADSNMTIRIDNMKRAAELSDKQVSKLEVAAKGAVKSYMVRVRAQLVERATERGFEFNPDVEPEQKTKVELENKDDARLLRSPMIWIEYLSGVEEERIWKSAVKSIITDEQATRIQRLKERRTTDRQSITVSKYIARIDQELLLSDEQKKQLWSAVNEKYGESLRDNYGHWDGQMTSRNLDVNAGAVAAGHEFLKVDLSLVDGILSESQIDLWKYRFGCELPSMKGFDEYEKARKAKEKLEQAKQ